MKLSFKTKAVTKSLLSLLPERARDVMERRYGLFGDAKEGMTLEAIGEIYGITRERVRQIENASLESIHNSENYNKAAGAFEELEDLLTRHGGVVREEDFLNEISSDLNSQNHVNFLLTLSDSFVRLAEDDHFYHRWTNDQERAEKVHQALHNLRGELNEDEVIAETEIIIRFLKQLQGVLEEGVQEHHARRWLRLSKHIGSNSLGEWGLARSPSIRPRGIRDLAYLVLRKHAKPLHFTQVAEEIEKMFDREAHVATTHNELIKDNRFVLVGRGLYALSQWGYTSGVVRDVIRNVIKEKGPLPKDDLIKEVLRQRQVKENTIYVNLQNSRHFKKDSRGRYTLVG